MVHKTNGQCIHPTESISSWRFELFLKILGQLIARMSYNQLTKEIQLLDEWLNAGHTSSAAKDSLTFFDELQHDGKHLLEKIVTELIDESLHIGELSLLQFLGLENKVLPELLN